LARCLVATFVLSETPLRLFAKMQSCW